jgi:predicted nucleotidyltransferase
MRFIAIFRRLSDYGSASNSRRIYMARFALNPDYRDFLSECNAQNVEYLVIGGQAVIFYGYVRNTKDLDVWINPTPENARRVYAAIAAFGTLTADTEADWFAQAGNFFAIGNYPYRIELLTTIPGVTFPDCYSRRVEIDVEGVRVPFIQLDDLLQNKRTTGRAQDIADIDVLSRRRR